MKKLKKEIRWFSIMEYEKEENYLSKRHLEGWKFKSVTFPGLYTFERCEPEKVIYQLDYNKEGIKHQSEYIRMFEDCGWEYLTEFDGYNYFRKPADKMQQKEEIFCDDISRLDMMNRIFRGRVIPLILMILCKRTSERIVKFHSLAQFISNFSDNSVSSFTVSWV